MLIQTIVSDLDDTLLMEDHTIGDYTVQVINQVRQKGIQFILASGRSPKSMAPFVHQLNLNLPFVANNGATVVDTKTGEFLYDLQFSPQQVRACLQFAKENGVYVQAYHRDHFYYSIKGTGCDTEYEYATKMEGIYMEGIEKNWDHPSSKVLMMMAPEKVEALYHKGVAAFGEWVQFTTSKANFLELNPKEASKGNALKWLAEKGILKQNSTMVFGDSLNDISMLSWAGYPVAMENARQEAKDIAKFISLSNNSQGVGRAIERLILKGEQKID